MMMRGDSAGNTNQPSLAAGANKRGDEQGTPVMQFGADIVVSLSVDLSAPRQVFRV